MKVLVVLSIILAMIVAGPQLGGGGANVNAGADAESEGEIGSSGETGDGDHYGEVGFSGPHCIEGGSANAIADLRAAVNFISFIGYSGKSSPPLTRKYQGAIAGQ